MTILANPLYASRRFDTIAALTASGLTYAPGSVNTVVAGNRVEAEGFQYEVAPSGAVDQHLTTAGGVKLYFLPDVSEARVTPAFLATMLRYITSDLTYQIPTDFATMQAAVDATRHIRVANGTWIILNFEAGHQPTHGLKVQNGDYSHYKITATDGEVTLAAGFVGVGPSVLTTNASNTFILGMRAQMPLLSCIVDAAGRARNGYFAFDGSTGALDLPDQNNFETAGGPPIAGVKNCQYFNIRGRNGTTIRAKNVVATGAGINGIYSNGLGTIYAEFSDASGAVQYGFCANRGARISADNSKADNCGVGYRALRASLIEAEASSAVACGVGYLATLSSTIYAQGGNASGSLLIGSETTYRGCGAVAVRGSHIGAQNMNVSGAARYGIWALELSNIVARSANCQTSGIFGVFADNGSFVDASGANGSSATEVAFEALHGARIIAQSATGNNCGISGVRARFGAEVMFRSGTATGNTSHNIFAINHGRVDASSATVTGGGAPKVRANFGSFITLAGATTNEGFPGVPQLADVNVTEFNALTVNGAIFA